MISISRQAKNPLYKIPISKKKVTQGTESLHNFDKHCDC